MTGLADSLARLFFLMSNPHTIRLNGPWEMTTPSTDQPRRVKLPADWPLVLSACETGPSTLQRWFHRPTGLDDTTAVQLVLTSLPCRGSVSLNDARLGDFQAGQRDAFDVGKRLTPRGCLKLSLEKASLDASSSRDEPAPGAATSASGPTPEIALLIQPRS